MPPIKLQCKAIKAVARDAATEVKMSAAEEAKMAVYMMREQSHALASTTNQDVLGTVRPFRRSHPMGTPYLPVPRRVPYAPHAPHGLQRPWCPTPGGRVPSAHTTESWEMEQIMSQEARLRARARAEVEFEVQARAEYEAEVYARAEFAANARVRAQLGARASALAMAGTRAQLPPQIPSQVHRPHLPSASGIQPRATKPASGDLDTSVPTGLMDRNMKARHEEYKAKQDAWLQKALDDSLSRYKNECGGYLEGPAKPEQIKSDVMWDELFLDHHAKPGVSLSGKQPKPRKKTWNENYTRLTEYLEKYPGDWMVLTLQHEPKWRTLHFWARDQRKFMNKGTLPEDRAKRLKNIGFLKAKSLCYYPKSRNYIFKSQNGVVKKQPGKEEKNKQEKTASPPVPSSQAVATKASAPPNNTLATMPTAILYRPEAKAAVTTIQNKPHVIPSSSEPTWDAMFKRLVDFYVNNGHSNITKTNCRDTELLEWVLLQRSPRAEIDSVKRARLESIGFVFDMDQHKWDMSFKGLLDFKKSYESRGLSMEELILFALEEEDADLYSWVNDQRVAEWQGDLRGSRKQRLEAIGVPWFKNSFKWYKMYDQLVHFQQALGHTKVPSTTTLGKWLQRQRRNPGDVTLEQKRLLQKLGVTFSTKR
mmetsp:Transcript_27928/g.39269  ORF Transcript_27928/g.39269 Transcript_27928/m.39269 type:complete len:649 (+) Transcript_27928:8-1954(+)